MNNDDKACDYCKEKEDAKLKKVELIFHWNNPRAYGYPEIVNWKHKYIANHCPVCGRILEDE